MNIDFNDFVINSLDNLFYISAKCFRMKFHMLTATMFEFKLFFNQKKQQKFYNSLSCSCGYNDIFYGI